MPKNPKPPSAPEPERLTESEIAFIDAIRSLVQIMLAANVAPIAAFDRVFAHHRDGYMRSGMVQAAGMMEMVRRLATDPQAEAFRQLLRRTLTESPKGSA